MKVVTSAPAKVILFGEHAVVYGEPAIATALDIRVRASVEEADERYIEAYALGKPVSDLKPIEAILAKVEADYGLKLRVRIDSDIPLGAGLGSSAASAVAVSAGVSKILKGELDKEFIVSLADIAEEIAHGKPSGIDTRITTYGGTMLYIRGEKPTFTDKLSGGITIADTGIPRSTRELVLGVKSLKERIPPVNKAIEAIGDLVRRVRKRLEAETKLEDLKEESRINHGLLRSIGVSHPALDKLVRIAKSNGYGAKLTGAGGGGSAIGFGDLREIRREALEEIGNLYNTRPRMLKTTVGAEGVRLEGRFLHPKI